jgi:hypothetical protein
MKFWEPWTRIIACSQNCRMLEQCTFTKHPVSNNNTWSDIFSFISHVVVLHRTWHTGVNGVCGNNVFTLFTTDCVFQHRLIQYLVIELFRFYNEETVGRNTLWYSVNVTTSFVVLSQTQTPLPINQFLSSQCSSFCPRPTVIFQRYLIEVTII